MRTNFTRSNAYQLQGLDISTNGDFVYLNDIEEGLNSCYKTRR